MKTTARAAGYAGLVLMTGIATASLSNSNLDDGFKFIVIGFTLFIGAFLGFAMAEGSHKETT